MALVVNYDWYNPEQGERSVWIAAAATVAALHVAVLVGVVLWPSPKAPKLQSLEPVFIDMAEPLLKPIAPKAAPPLSPQSFAEPQIAELDSAVPEPVLPDMVKPEPPAEVALPKQKPKPQPKPEPVKREVEKAKSQPVQKAAPQPKPAPQQMPAENASAQGVAESAGDTVSEPPQNNVPAGVSASELADIKSRWAAQLLAALEREKRYPDRAQRRRQEGVAQVAFAIDTNGGVSRISLHKSSGFALLDREAEELPKRAAPLPPPPAEVTTSSIMIVMPIAFNIR